MYSYIYIYSLLAIPSLLRQLRSSQLSAAVPLDGSCSLEVHEAAAAMGVHVAAYLVSQKQSN